MSEFPELPNSPATPEPKSSRIVKTQHRHKALAPLKDLTRLHKDLPKLKERAVGIGIDVEAIRFTEHSLSTSGTTSELQAIPEKLKHELTHPIDVVVNDGVEDQNIRYLLLNSEQSEGKPVTVFFPGITAEVDKNMANLEARELAKVVDGPVVALDIPPFGGAGKFTHKQIEEMKKGEGLGEIAKSHLRALKQIIEERGYGGELDLTGYSLGGYMAAEVARHAKEFGIKVRNVVLVETPGVEEMSKKELMGRLQSEAPFQDLYVSVPYSYESRKAMDMTHSTPIKLTKQVKWFMKNVRPSLQMAESLRQNRIPTYIEQTVNQMDDTEILVVNGSNSPMSPQSANNSMFAQFDNTMESGSRQRIHRKVVEGATHAAFLNPYRLAETLRDGIGALNVARAARSSGPLSTNGV